MKQIFRTSRPLCWIESIDIDDDGYSDNRSNGIPQVAPLRLSDELVLRSSHAHFNDLIAKMYQAQFGLAGNVT